VISQIEWHSLKERVYSTADQIICGYNRTRQALNKDIRQYLGFHHQLPQKGDKLICTKNNWNKTIEDIALVNGMTGFVDHVKHNVEKDYDSVTRETMRIRFRPDF